jgi:hypothetical protein
MSGRIRAVVAGALLAAVALGATIADAARRRAAREELAARHAAVVELTGLPDLALSSSARWLRHPSQAEAGAAVADLPASLDVDPAGAMIGPPRDVIRVGAVEVTRR